MTQKLQPLRGMPDMMPERATFYRKIVNICLALAEQYGFKEVKTPILESIYVFKRTLGESSDIVNKEMYSFEDRSGEPIVMRPEGTAPVVRAYINNSGEQTLPFKAFYEGPMFRYERPQKGRYRQFHQVGVECLGISEYTADVEALMLSASIIKNLKINATLNINTLGDTQSRNQHREALIEYFTKYERDLSEDSKVRLKVNPLRILDSKAEEDQAIIRHAPQITDYLNNESKNFFDNILSTLSLLNIEATVNPKLVRGLDYYEHTVFEWMSNDLGAQSAVLAGGRYNGLVKSMGGGDVPGVGWAAGVERLMLLADIHQDPPKKVGVVVFSTDELDYGFKVLDILKSINVISEMAPVGKAVGKSLKWLDSNGFDVAILIGEDEKKSNTLTVKLLKQGFQEQVPESDLLMYINSR